MPTFPTRVYAPIDYNDQRARLHKIAGYIPRENFLVSTTWATNTNEEGVKVFSIEDGLTPMQCDMTGVVSKEGLYLLPSGDCKFVGNPPCPSIPLSNACLKFSLVEPTDTIHSPLIGDFTESVKIVQNIVSVLPDDARRCSPFLTLNDQGKWQFNFQFQIFRKKYHYSISGSTNQLEPVDVNEYYIAEEYRPLLSALKHTYHARRLPMWDSSGEGIDYDRLADFMTDNLVQTTFTLTFDPTQGLIGEVGCVSILN